MKLALVTDAWTPQVNGVVTTLLELVQAMRALGHEVLVLHPGLFTTRPCPGYAGIDLAIFSRRRLQRMLDAFQPDAIHLATEGPLGWAARRHCLAHGLSFTTAFHTRFPEILQAALRLPLDWGYGLFRRFHRPSSGVLVPTRGVQDMLQRRGFAQLRPWTHGVDTGLFGFAPQAQAYPPLGLLPRPVSLYVGRVSYEKNIDAFLSLDVPGSKVVCGVGPLEGTLRSRYPGAHWLGVLDRPTLARVYAAADVLVFPSRAETFGLVMLEAMACGTPVAAYPVDGPLEVLGRSNAGVLDHDLASAWRGALLCARTDARRRALEFSWSAASRQFLQELVPARKGPPLRGTSVTGLS